MKHKGKKIFAALVASTMICSAPVYAANNTTDVFYDDFSGTTLDTNKWLIADKSWGGNNGGVVPENVSVSNGTLKLEGHGNKYKGNVKGHNQPTGIRTGAAIATRNYYSSGSYEVVAKVAPELGACSAIWTFEYEEYYPGDPEYEASGKTGQYYAVNHEIDIELPTANATHKTPSFEAARFNTFTTENGYSMKEDLPYAVDDGKFHTYRFDWHTCSDTEEKRVDYYVDDIYMCTSRTQVPSNAGRFWIGLWFPTSIDADKDGICETGWTGTADFDTTVFEIDSVKIEPYHESGDTPQKESFPYDGWAIDSFPELIDQEKYNHIINGDFSEGKTAWTLSGDATVLNEKAVLSSGSKTDTISQLIDVKQRMTYTISADIETDGTEVTIGARKKNGTFNSSQTFNKSGHVEVSFVTDAGSSQQMEAYAQVLRYQQGTPVKVDNIKVTSGKASTVIPTPTPKPDVFQLVANGEFDEGDKNWKLSGSTIIENGHAVLASGSDTDGLSQKISVEGGKTYTLTANVISSGTNIDVGIKDYNGRYTNIHQTLNKSGTMTLTFTTAKHIKEVELYAEVVRYQSNNNPVYLDSIVLKEGKEEITPDQPEIPEIPASGLLNNGTFTQGNSYWTLGGSASISLGKAILTSGCDTDTISQKVSVETGKTYKLTCDIESDGCNVDLMIQGHDGKYSNKKLSYSTNTKGELVFTVGKVHSESKVVMQVLRYQNGSVKVSNIQLEEMK